MDIFKQLQSDVTELTEFCLESPRRPLSSSSYTKILLGAGHSPSSRPTSSSDLERASQLVTGETSFESSRASGNSSHASTLTSSKEELPRLDPFDESLFQIKPVSSIGPEPSQIKPTSRGVTSSAKYTSSRDSESVPQAKPTSSNGTHLLSQIKPTSRSATSPRAKHANRKDSESIPHVKPTSSNGAHLLSQIKPTSRSATSPRAKHTDAESVPHVKPTSSNGTHLLSQIKPATSCNGSDLLLTEEVDASLSLPPGKAESRGGLKGSSSVGKLAGSPGVTKLQEETGSNISRNSSIDSGIQFASDPETNGVGGPGLEPSGSSEAGLEGLSLADEIFSTLGLLGTQS